MTNDATATRVAQAAVTALRESARRNKRLSAQHRRAAQQDMEAQQQLYDRCREIGIEVVIHEPEA